MALAKLTIDVEDKDPIEVLFNPTEISMTKQANWKLIPTAERDVPEAQFTYGDPAMLSMNLFFDTYEARTDVRRHTQMIFNLATVEQHGELHRPPLCRLRWGAFTFDDYQWVLQNLTQNFTLFLDNGLPVRATLSCSFRQWRSDRVEAKLLNKQSADVAKQHIVRRGETLSSIAQLAYQDTALWRLIADANGLDDARTLSPGQRLSIPVLDLRNDLRR